MPWQGVRACHAHGAYGKTSTARRLRLLARSMNMEALTQLENLRMFQGFEKEGLEAVEPTIRVTH